MKTFTALFALILTAVFTLSAPAQEVAGTWQVETVSEVEPPEGASLTLSFGEENKATVTYTLAGEAQSWQYTYAVAEGQLTLEPVTALGEPKPVTYDIKFDEGKMQLLTPKPEPVEEEAKEAEIEGDVDAEPTDEGDAESETEEAAETEAEEGAEAEGDSEAEETAKEETKEEVEEEDTRVPVWVLTKA